MNSADTGLGQAGFDYGVPAPVSGGGAAAASRAAGEKGAAQKSRATQKDKLQALASELAELEQELAKVQDECKQLEEANQKLLEQAREREGELEREKAKLARLSQAAPGGGAAADRQGTADAGGSSGTMQQSAGHGTMQAPAVQVVVPPAAAESEEPLMVVTSCQGYKFVITRHMLEECPRLDLPRIYGHLMQSLITSLKEHGEIDSALKTALLHPGANASPQLLQQRLQAAQDSLRAIVADIMKLYTLAFQVDPVATANMHASRGVAMAGAAPPKPSLPSAMQLQRQFALTGEGIKNLADSVKTYLKTVTTCMEERKKLQERLAESSEALLEFESIAQWLNNEAAITELQKVLAREVDAYLEWATGVCTQLWSPVQAAQYLSAYQIGDILQVCCMLLQPEETAAAPHMSMGGVGTADWAVMSVPQS